MRVPLLLLIFKVLNRFVVYGNAVYITCISSKNASKLQAILNAAARLLGGHVSSFRNYLQWLPIYTAHTVQDLLPHNKLSCWLCSTISQFLLLSQYLLCLVVPAFSFWLGATGFYGSVQECCYCGPIQLSQFIQSIKDLFPISSDQFRKHLKTSLFVSEDSDPGREHPWFKWHYVNTWFLRLS